MYMYIQTLHICSKKILLKLGRFGSPANFKLSSSFGYGLPQGVNVHSKIGRVLTYVAVSYFFLAS